MPGNDEPQGGAAPTGQIGPIEWTGNLNDDCTAVWRGLMLRAEEMDRRDWWWAVYDETSGEVIGSSNESDVRVLTGKKARAAAELVAKEWVRMGAGGGEQRADGGDQ